MIHLAGATLKAFAHVVKVRLSCANARCAGTLRLELSKVLTARAGKAHLVVIGSSHFSIAAGKSAKIAVKLKANGQKAIASAPRHRLSVIAAATVMHGKLASRHLTLKLVT